VGSPNTCICKAESLCWTAETQHSKSNIREWKNIKRIHQHVEKIAQKANRKMHKDSQTYSQRKIHREQGRKGKGWFKSWRVPMGEDSEYKGYYTVGDMPWMWVVRAIYWTHKSWGLTQGRETPLDGCRATWTNRRSVGSTDSPLQEHVLRGLGASHNEEDRLRTHLWMPVFPTTAHTYTRHAYSLWPICTGAGAAMTRRTAGMWETEVHLAQGGMRLEEPGSCSWRALT